MNKNETIADIRKEAEARFRELLEKHVDSLGHIQAMQQFNQAFDRIEAVQKREQSQSWHHREMEELVLRHEKELADARMSSGNAAKLREALSDACYAMFNFLKTQNGGYEEMANALDKAKAALAVPLRECDRFDDDLQADNLHAAFVKYCNDCDCPMGCIHRMEMKGLLNVQCASILKCFARFALSEADTEKEGAE